MGLFSDTQQQSGEWISWTDAPEGAEVTLEITAEPVKVQQKKNGMPLYWDAPLNTRPKEQIIVNGKMKGKDWALSAAIPSDLHTAIGKAEQAVNADIGPGGVLRVKFTKWGKAKTGAAKRLFEAEYKAGTVATSRDPWQTAAPDDEPPF